MPQGQPPAPGGCSDPGVPAGSVPPTAHQGRPLRWCGSPPSHQAGHCTSYDGHRLLQGRGGCDLSSDGETEAGRAVEVAGVKASVRAVLLLRHLCEASYSPGLSQGGSGRSQNVPFGAKTAERPKVSPPGSSLLARRPSCQRLASARCAG